MLTHGWLPWSPRTCSSAVVGQVPTEWLEPAPGLADAAAVRAAYVDHLRARVDQPSAWLPGGAA